MLKRRTELGRIHMVKSLLPIPVPADQTYIQKEETAGATSHEGQKQDEWVPPVDLSQLEEKEQRIVREMLRQEAGAFARNDDDVFFYFLFFIIKFICIFHTYSYIHT